MHTTMTILPLLISLQILLFSSESSAAIVGRQESPLNHLTNMADGDVTNMADGDVTNMADGDVTNMANGDVIAGQDWSSPRGNFSLRALPPSAALQNLDAGLEKDNVTIRGSLVEAVKFMKKFGYVPAGDKTSDFIFSAESLKEKLKTVQKFGAIPQTGEMDEATIKLMTSPRCGVHDVINPEEGKRRRKRFILGASGWNKRRLTYFIANWSRKLISKENVQTELRRAFNHWSEYSRLQFKETDSNEADIVIFFAEYNHNDYYPFDGQGGVLAHAYYPYGFEHLGGDIHFDESEDWSFRPEDDNSGLDFFTVAVHEIGHSLGLAHSPVSSSIMFPYYKGVERNFALDYDDIMAMWELYIKRKLDGDDEYFRTSTTPSPIPTTTATTTTTTTKTTTTTTPFYDITQNDGVRYHGDYDTVDEHERKKGENPGDKLPSLPPLFPDNGEEDYYEKEKRRREEEERRWREKEENERRRWEEERRREEEEIIRREEEDRKWREEEEERRRREWESRKTTTLAPPPVDDVIDDVCEGSFDTMAFIRGELFIFKGKHMWRYEEKGRLLPGYPALIRSLFSYLPTWVHKIDAAYERKNDSRIIFFIGKYYFVHDGNQLLEGSPRPVTDYGIDESFTKIDAVLFWPKNNLTYLFRRNLYWRRDDFQNYVEEENPRGIERWNGLPQNLDTATTDKHGVSFFFKGKQVWRYDNTLVRPTFDSPSSDLRSWTGC